MALDNYRVRQFFCISSKAVKILPSEHYNTIFNLLLYPFLFNQCVSMNTSVQLKKFDLKRKLT